MIAIGTRPEAIKLAPIADALRERGIAPMLLFTGQHPLNASEHGLGDYRSATLRCPGGSEPFAQAYQVAAAAMPLLAEAGLVIVQGDTSSAFGVALGASSARVPLAHVEAGLRSHDSRRPWPEEDFRVAIDRLAQLLFAPTQLSAANLRRERVPGSIHVTGNSGIDAVLRVAGVQRPRNGPREGPRRLLVTCHRRESWGAGLAGVAGALRAIADQGIASIDLLLHPNPATAAHMRSLLLGCDQVALHPPLAHRQAIAAMIHADCVLTDSGGMQEECAALGVPLLVLRERTERPEAIACGMMKLVGTEPERIVRQVRAICQGGRDAPDRAGQAPYGDGRASERIAAVVAASLENASGGSPQMETRRSALL